MDLNRAEKAAYMTLGEFNSLLEYSTTLPTGTTTGKVWKRQTNIRNCILKPSTPPRWLLGEYGEIEGDQIAIHWYDVFIKVQGVNYDEL